MDKDHKRFDHQRRPQMVVLERARRVFVAIISPLRSCRDFDQLHELIKETLRSIPGVRKLHAYDTTLRLGAFPNLTTLRMPLRGCAPAPVYKPRFESVRAKGKI